ncbi:MAG: hypothetical protein P8J20_20230 [Novosphingobium sp.]|nr:hypothetical protein [Novosphingobium sp.]
MQLGARYGELFQISYITRDMDAAIEHARTELGIDNFHVGEATAEVLSGGKVQELVLIAAMANIGRHQFEILQPISGPTHIYTDEVDLDAHILNFHHHAIAVTGGHDSWDTLLAEVRASGDEIAFLFPAEPSPDDQLAFCYVDTRKRLGHYTEYLWWDDALNDMPSVPRLNA